MSGEYTLDIIEATKALEEGRCEEIEDEDGKRYVIQGGKLLDVNCINLLSLNHKSILGKWRLIGVKPEKKKVVLENVLWKSFTPGIVYPFVFPKKEVNFDWEGLLDKPHMKMTLEWEE